MKKTFEAPVLDVIRFTVNEEITTTAGVPDISVGVGNWEDIIGE